ncbi:sensor histidine kinase [Kitasatospora sp. NPDC051853]|uniref:sensor histidine kinase n=1 Tax=Kitasatospora sp. NPDC051853 TaxID=3364058 RepID=UPI0037BD8698
MASTPTTQDHGRPGRALARACAELAGGAVLVLVTQLILTGPGPSARVQSALAVAALVPLTLRRRFPVAALLGAAAVLGLYPPAGLPAAVVAYSTARRLTEPRRRIGVLLAAGGLTVAVAAVAAPPLHYGGHGFGLGYGAVLAATTLVLPGLLGGTGGQEERLLRALRERAEAAEAARRLADSEARTQERSRIAAEMHDLIGHRLSVVSLHAGGLEMAMGEQSPDLRDEAALVRRSVGEAMRELRELLGVLGPLEPEGGPAAATAATGTRADVAELVGESRAAGVRVAVAWEGPDLDGCPARVRHAVHRVVRESLTNVHRYAPGAEVTVAVVHTEDRVEVRVRNGEPPVPPRARTGLGTGRGQIGLRERLALLGGTLAAGPEADGGYAVTASMPAEPGPAGPGPAVARTVEEPSGAVGGSGSGAAGRRAVRVAGGLVGLLGVGVTMLGGLVLASQAFQAPEPAPAREEPVPGMHRAALLRAIYADDPASRAAAAGREPAHPAGATECLYGPDRPGPPTGPTDGPGRLRITRYCLRDDVLIAVDAFTVPLAARTPPWETP